MNVYVFVKRWGRKLAFSKRQQLVTVTLLLTTGLVLTQLVGGTGGTLWLLHSLLRRTCLRQWDFGKVWQAWNG